MKSRIIFTKEEKEEDIELVLQGLKDGQSYSKIASDLGRSIQYIANIKKILIERGLITQEDIDSFSYTASQAFILKEPVLQKLREGKNIQEIANELNASPSRISQVRQILLDEGLITLDEIDNLNRRNTKRKDLKAKVLQGFKSGKLASEISSELRIARTTISRLKKELISEGLISEQEISDLQKQALQESNPSRKTTISRNNADCPQFNDIDKQILNLLLQGYPIAYISKTLNIDNFDLTNTIKTLKKNKHVTASQINEARQIFKEKEEKLIISYLRRGYSQADIKRKLPHLNSGTLSRLITSLINAGKISREQIEQYQYEAPQGEQEIMEFVLSKLRLGFTVKEIIEADENGFLTERRVRDATKKLVMQGQISQKEIEKAKSKRTKQKKKDDYSIVDKEITKMLKSGLSPLEIANSISMTPDFVYSRIRNLRQMGKLSDSAMDSAKKKRDSRAKASNYSEDYRIILAMLKAGYCQKEIAAELNRSCHFVHTRIQELKECQKISTEEIAEAAKNAKKHPKEQRNWSLYLENNYSSEEKKLIDNYQQLKSVLKAKGINNYTSFSFIYTCKEMLKINRLLPEDVPLLRDSVDYSPVSLNNINLMLRVYVSFKQYQEAIRFLNGLIGSLEEDSPLISICRKTKASIIYCQKQDKAINLLKSGMAINQVYRNVGLSESEVVMLMRKITNSDDEEPLIRFDDLEIE